MFHGIGSEWTMSCTVDQVEILNDEQWEPDEEFFLKLNLVSGEEENVELGRINVLEITILNDDSTWITDTHPLDGWGTVGFVHFSFGPAGSPLILTIRTVNED